MADLSRESVAQAIEAQSAARPDIVVGEKSGFLKRNFQKAHDFIEGVRAMGSELGQRLGDVKDRADNGYSGLAEVTNDRMDRALGAPPPPGKSGP